MPKKNGYSECKSGVIQRGEQIFPFNCFDIEIDWDELIKPKLL